MQGYKTKNKHIGDCLQVSFIITRYVAYAILLWLLGLQKEEKWDKTITFSICKHEQVHKALFPF